MLGLLSRHDLAEGQAMLLQHTRSVHTFGMRFEIKVAFLGWDLEVLQTRTVPPGRIVLPRLRAHHVLECRPDSDLRPGDRLLALAPHSGAGVSEDDDQRARQSERYREGDQTDPGGQRHRLPAGTARLDEPQELEERAHDSSSASSDDA
jgi:hypothetical protein